MPSGASSNADAVTRRLLEFAASISFESRGASSSLGRDLLAAQAVDIRDETIAGQSPDGSAIAANRGEFGRRQGCKGRPPGGGLRPSRAGDAGRMLSLVEVAGEQVITATTAQMSYGTIDRVRRVAHWFTAGASGDDPSGAEGQPARPFFGISDEARAKRLAEIRAFVRAQIGRFNGS